VEEIYDELGGGAEKRDSDDDSDEDMSADRMIMVLHVYDLSLCNLHICLLTDFMLSFVSYLVRPISPWRGTVVERRSLAGELSLSCARPAADG